MSENVGVLEGQEGRRLFFKCPGINADLLVSFQLITFDKKVTLACIIAEWGYWPNKHLDIVCSVLDLNAFERQNKAEGLGMVSEEGTSKST